MTAKKAAKPAELVRVKIKLHSPNAHVYLPGRDKIRTGSVIEVTPEEKEGLGTNCHTTDEELYLVPNKLKPHQFGYKEQQERIAAGKPEQAEDE